MIRVGNLAYVNSHMEKSREWLGKAEESMQLAESTAHGDDSRDTIAMADAAIKIANLHFKLADRG
jgi:hypothetical protein